MQLNRFAWVLVSCPPTRSFHVTFMPRHTARFQSGNDLVSSNNDLSIFHLEGTVESTQEEAKRLLIQHPGWLAVMAENQSKGRGTSGRSWVATQGNLFLTCAIPMEVIPLKKLTLLPLGVGLLVAETLQPYVTLRPTVKWPNDVLVDSKKIAGTLIENCRLGMQDFWLVGIGVNVQTFPSALPSEAKDFRSIPRNATSLHEHAKPNTTLPSAMDLGTELASKLRVWTNNLDRLDTTEFVSKWKAWSDMEIDYEIRETGTTVRIVDLESDGRLLVQDEGGNQRLLVADYFF